MKIEMMKYIDVNNVSDNQDTYNYIAEKLNEIINVVNGLDEYVSALSKRIERGNNL